MNAPPSRLAALVDGLPASAALETFEVAGKLEAAAATGDVSDLDRAELFAFRAVGMDPGLGQTSWGGYFGPFMSLRDAAGVLHESPSLALVTPGWIEYWSQRSSQVSNPVARARYADLVWDLWRVVKATKPGIEIARRAIDGHLAALRARSHHLHGFSLNSMARALYMARRVKDSTRARLVVEAILQYDEAVFEEDLLGTWTIAFDQLMIGKAPELTPEERTKLERDLESRYARSLEMMAENGMPFPALELAQRLASHYRGTGRESEVRRVLGPLAEGIPDAVGKPAALVGHAWLGKVDQLLREFGQTALRASLDPTRRKLGAAALGDLKELSVEVRIPTERVEEYLRGFTELPDQEALKRIARHFVRTRGQLEKQLEERRQTAPLATLFPTIRLDSRGRQVGELGAGWGDEDGRLVAQAAQGLQFGGVFLRQIFERLGQTGRLTTDLLAEFCGSSAGAEPGRQGILNRGLDAFVAGDAIVALHLLVPCFEDTVRELARLLGPLPLKFDPGSGAYHEPGLRAVLDQPGLQSLVGEDLVLYWRALFTDPEGINLRNQLAHGLLIAEDCTLSSADRVVHALLQLGLFRKIVDEAGDGAS